MSPAKTTADDAPGATEPVALPEEMETATREGVWPWIRTPVLMFGGVLAVVVSVASIWFLNVIETVGASQIFVDEEETENLTDPWDFGRLPRNVLLLGSDSRAGLSEEEQAAFGSEETVGGQRTDTMILLSIDPRRERAVVVHFPRDLRVAIPGHGLNKINAAFELGGPDLVIDTVKRFSGLPIHNYMEIDLAGFEHLVDTLGGVKICVDRAMHDPLAGLDIPAPGCYEFDGRESLAFVRARNIEGDQIPDFSRIRRQQQFMRSMMNRLFSVGSLLQDEVIAEAVGAVRTDDSLTATDLIELGRRLRALAEEDPTGAESLDLRVVPGTTGTIDGVSYVLAEQPEAEDLFRALRQGRSLRKLGLDLALTDPTPAIIRVRVMPAPGGDPADAAVVVRRGGFVVLPSEPAPAGSTGSEIIFKSGARSRARVVSGFFPGLPVREVPSDLLGEAEVGIVVGDDFSSVVEEGS